MQPALPLPAEASVSAAEPRVLRGGLRFAFLYFVFAFFPGPLVVIPRFPYAAVTAPEHALTAWFGTHVLHVGQALHFAVTGSGDRLADYVQNLLALMLAAAGAAVWSFFDRAETSDARLHEWVRLIVRIELAVVLLDYGAGKVIKAQFPDPWLWRMLEPYGDSSPMGLLWTFVGVSKPYSMFTGAVEMLSGALLLLPRVTTLGAIFSVAALTNILALNLAYDVPVKLYSANLLLLALFLLAPELRRLADVFLFDRGTPAPVRAGLFGSRTLNRAMTICLILFGVYLAQLTLRDARNVVRTGGDESPKPALYGIYSVDKMTIDGVEHPPLFTDPLRWRRITIERYLVGIVPADGPVQRFEAETFEATRILHLTRGENTPIDLHYEVPSPGRLSVTGSVDGKQIVAELTRLPTTAFRLTSRGFHWINETPYNL
ncbi:MAG TPA: hypothetical protein VGH20_21685 [Myxococcales bacterium]|jgi:uncharacterized membrane protein YphA (DoxX/SURF4 family)